MSLTVLRLGIDTLEASIGGPLRPHALPVLADWKNRAQTANSPLEAPLGGLEFAFQPQGQKPYAYKLAGDEASICLSPSEKQPGAFVRLSSLGLASWDPASLLGLLCELTEGFFGPGGIPKLSRIDVAADFQGFNPADKGSAQFVCPAEFRPVYPNIERPETFQFGKGKIVVRIYNKTREIAESHKHWLPELWALHPGYVSEEDVWRFEVQMRREIIREFGDPSPFEAIEAPEAFLRYGLDWADLRIPEGRSSNRWHRHEAWEALAEASASHTVLARETPGAHLASLTHLANVIAGYAVSAGAVLEAETFEETWSKLGACAQERFNGDGDFAAQARRRHIERLGKGDVA